MRRRYSIFRLRFAIRSRVRLAVRIAGGLGLAVSRHNVAPGKRPEAWSHHIILCEQSSAVVDPRHELGHAHLLGPEISTANNGHQASDR